jgi:cytochrome c551/c552
MKKRLLTTLLLAAATLPALAGDPLELVRDKQFLACHSLDKDGMAPALRNIAIKFRRIKGADQMLADTISKGSPLDASGAHWGTMRMPGAGVRVPVSPAEAHQLADWILSL